MILSFLFFTFLAYLLFRLVFDFIIPIYKTTKKVKQTFREMNERMNGQQPENSSSTHKNTSATDAKKSTLGDYIDFEEVKE
ncbi:MAG: hypothetical protein EON98_05960 [Chitinophagaceae bacterium]|nr:MAG: hypothetical protein EON98_05960 [Chitinophagaceae bacterium]